MGDAVGDVVGIQRGAAEGADHSQRGGACVDVDEIPGADKVGCRLSDAALLADSQRFLCGHRRLVSQELAVR